MTPRNPRVSNGARYRRERARVLREEDVCAWCGQWVDKTLPKGHPLAPVVDHIVTLFNGGPVHGRQNKQLMHSDCNLKKGKGLAGPVPETIDPTSQGW